MRQERTGKRGPYVCVQCGGISPQWSGQCPECAAWNSLEPQVTGGGDPRAGGGYAGKTGVRDGVARLAGLPRTVEPRYSTGCAELDRVLGGGMVPGCVVLIGGDPGIGKSTLLLQSAARMAKARSGLYVTGEESLTQVATRADRLGVSDADVGLLAETEVTQILEYLATERPAFVVIDSVQTLYSRDFPGAPGTVTQVRECVARLTRFAKETATSVFLVGHVTKGGDLAGPRVLEHIVDTVLLFEGQSDSRFRLLRALKNRFGAINELGVFAMGDRGLQGVKNPSSIFLARGSVALPGSAVAVLWEGTRPLLLEIQALVDETQNPSPRRVTVGLDPNRLAMLLAILSRHARVHSGQRDVFVNAVGGIRVSETGADLAIVTALYSSFRDKALPEDWVCFGELGLAGEIRPVQSGQERLKEASKHGFRHALVPLANVGAFKDQAAGQLTVHGVSELRAAIAIIEQALTRTPPA